jgi:hypothetical protein
MSEKTLASDAQTMRQKNRIIRESASMYFENNKDLVAANDFVQALKLGCFDREFTYFGTAYLVGGAVQYRISGKELELRKYVEKGAVHGLAPTPALCVTRRYPVPSGKEDAVKEKVIRETGRAVRELYNQIFFDAVAGLAARPATNAAFEGLEALRESLDGSYDKQELHLFEGMLLTAIDSRVLSIQGYQALANWLEDVFRQMADDITLKGNYRKTLSGFAWEDKNGKRGFFGNAMSEATYRARDEHVLRGLLCTPVFSREYSLRDMAEFPQVRRNFQAELEECFADRYFKRLHWLKSLPAGISAAEYLESAKTLEGRCSETAWQVFQSLRLRWNIK